MGGWKLPWQGGCRCGGTRLRVSTPPLMAAACHCTGCRRMAASAFSLTLIVPSEGFEVTAGEPVIGGVQGPTRHHFCRHCLSWMFTRPEGMDHIVNLRPSMLDGHGWFVPFIETWTREKLAWASLPAVHSYPAFPDPATFPALIEDYARRGARPA